MFDAGGGMTSQLKVRAGGNNSVNFANGGLLMAVRSKRSSEKVCAGEPTTSDQEKE